MSIIYVSPFYYAGVSLNVGTDTYQMAVLKLDSTFSNSCAMYKYEVSKSSGLLISFNATALSSFGYYGSSL